MQATATTAAAVRNTTAWRKVTYGRRKKKTGVKEYTVFRQTPTNCIEALQIHRMCIGVGDLGFPRPVIITTHTRNGNVIPVSDGGSRSL